MMPALSIRFGLHLAILLGVTVIIASSTLLGIHQGRNELNRQAQSDLLAKAGRIALLAERELRRSPSVVETDLTHAAADPRVDLIALVGADGRIHMAHRLAWRGQPARDLLPAELLTPQEHGDNRPPLVTRSPDATRIAVSVPFHTPAATDQVRGLERGLVVMRYDLEHTFAQNRAQVINSRLPAVIASVLLVILAALWINFRLARPLIRLEDVGQRLAAGEHIEPLAESGFHEVRRLARAFNRMATQVQTTHSSLRDSEQRYRQIFDEHPFPLWIHDTGSGRFLAVNDAAIRLYQYDRELFLKMNIVDLATHPHGASLSRDGIHRHRRRDGGTVLVETVRHPLEWFGHPAALVAAHDMTERLQAESDLRLAAAAFETSEAIMITDAEGRILRTNQAFTRITGFTAEEAQGRTPKLLNSGRHDKAFFRELWDSLNGPGHWDGEIWNRRKSGRIYPQWLSARSVRDEQGRVTHYVANFFDISERKAAEETIHHLTTHDALTDLPNRTLFHDRLTQALTASRRTRHCGAVLQLDIDRFKAVNDALGHAVGDELLRAIAHRLQSGLREGDTLARLGADEFAILLPDLPPPQETAARIAHTVAEKLRALTSHPIEVAGTRHHLALSAGVTLFPKGQDNADDLLREADTALHQAKDGGRNAVCFFEHEMGTQAQSRFALEAELRHGIEHGELRVHLQPQTDAQGKMLAMEALARWQHPTRGLIPPGMFIPVAEDSGLITGIGDWMLTECCAILVRQEIAHSGLRIAVNVSPRQFRQPDFTTRVKRILHRSGADPTRLILEVTEGVMLDHLSDTVAKMTELATLGIHFSIDDFGTGYSSLAYLKQLPIHELKIDRTFIQDAPTDPNDAAIVDTILAVARHLNLRVVAEGVETREQADFLSSRGAMLFQGYLFGRPEPADLQLRRWIAQESAARGTGGTSVSGEVHS